MKERIEEMELNTNQNPVNCIIRFHNNNTANLTSVTSVVEEENGSITVKRDDKIVLRASQGTWQSVEIHDRANTAPKQVEQTPYAT
jgi:hypothetical protein